MGDERGLEENTGVVGTFLLLEKTESEGLKVVELGEKGRELELPLLLPLDSLVEKEVLDKGICL